MVCFTPVRCRAARSGSHAHAGDNVGQEEHQPLQGPNRSDDPEHDENRGVVWPDLTKKEMITLLPLAIATIVFGIFPGPILELVEPAFQRILDMYP